MDRYGSGTVLASTGEVRGAGGLGRELGSDERDDRARIAVGDDGARRGLDGQQRARGVVLRRQEGGRTSGHDAQDEDRQGDDEVMTDVSDELANLHDQITSCRRIAW